MKTTVSQVRSSILAILWLPLPLIDFLLLVFKLLLNILPLYFFGDHLSANLGSMFDVEMPQCCWNVSVLQQKRCTSSNLFTRRTSPRQTCSGAITHERTHKQTRWKLELFTFTTEMRRGWNERVINHWEIPWCSKNILTSLLGGSLDVA